eukprot:m51a1_g7649 putative sodium hydrogen exchanger variant 1 (659) ;mRNA; f:382944-385428
MSSASSLLSGLSGLSSADDGGGGGSAGPHLTLEGFCMFTSALLLVCIVLSVFISSSRMLKWLHESSGVLLLGIVLGLVLCLASPGTSLWMSESQYDKVFFYALFPPVIFNAGLTLRSKPFVQNIGSILTFAVIGTILCSVLFGLLIWVLGKYGHTGSPDIVECLLFGSLISSTDTVATISILLDLNVQPLLYNLAFGESVINDATVIALFATLKRFTGKTLTWISLLHIVRDLCVVIGGSTLIGVGVGYLWVFIKFLQRKLVLSPTYDITMIVVSAYLAYSCAAMADLSGIISLFVCVVIISRYCWYTISTRARVSLFAIASSMDYLSQTFVFFSMGLMMFYRENPWNSKAWSPGFIFFSIICILLCRAISVFLLGPPLNLFRKNKIPFKYLAVLAWCGMRGVISMLLVLSLDTPYKHLYLNTTIVIICFTCFIWSALTRPFVKKMSLGSDVPGTNVVDPEKQRSVPALEMPSEGEQNRVTAFLLRFDRRLIHWVRHKAEPGSTDNQKDRVQPFVDKTRSPEPCPRRAHADAGAGGADVAPRPSMDISYPRPSFDGFDVSSLPNLVGMGLADGVGIPLVDLEQQISDDPPTYEKGEGPEHASEGAEASDRGERGQHSGVDAAQSPDLTEVAEADEEPTGDPQSPHQHHQHLHTSDSDN